MLCDIVTIKLIFLLLFKAFIIQKYLRDHGNDQKLPYIVGIHFWYTFLALYVIVYSAVACVLFVDVESVILKQYGQNNFSASNDIFCPNDRKLVNKLLMVLKRKRNV